ncbi:NAD-dependent epimerase/dehydratase family protein [Nocardia sienata]|uniref:NAD-dependent epimerase/dehydratase family protein n=1 Tax=Nocardia sienata TaxID=248552 RepID=UPI000A01A937|nr:NAD-dependent epimerase/dehydratase family protein [Nocardia sienata]
MKIVVTGASGNLGTALLRRAAEDGQELVGIARRRPPRGREPYDRARWVECDIGEPASAAFLAKVFAGAGVVVHLAWAVHPHRTDPPLSRTNADGTTNVLRAVADAGVRHVVCASSVAAYTPAARWSRVDEQYPCGGLSGSAYSSGKAELEAQLDAFEHRQPAIRVARIRPCAVVQADAAAELGDWLFGRWLPRAVLGRPGLPVPLWNGLRLQFVHAEDVAAAVGSIIEQRATGAFNLAADPVLTASDLAAAFGGFHVPVPHRALTIGAGVSWRLGLQPLHPAWLRLADRASLVDAGRAARELGWTPRYDASAACAELAAALRAHRSGPSAPLAPAHPAFRLGRPTHQSQRPPAAAGRTPQTVGSARGTGGSPDGEGGEPL